MSTVGWQHCIGLSVVSKTHTKIIERRLRNFVKGKLDDGQVGYRENKRTIDNIFS